MANQNETLPNPIQQHTIVHGVESAHNRATHLSLNEHSPLY